MADHLAGWQTFQFTVGKLLFSFCSFLLLLVLSSKTYVPDCMREAALDWQYGLAFFFFFYNYDFISFPNCAGNVKYLRCPSSIIVGSSSCALRYLPSLAWWSGPEPGRKRSLCFAQKSQVFCSWAAGQFCQFYLFLLCTCSGKTSLCQVGLIC